MSEEHEQWLSERYWPGLTAGLAESTLDCLRIACDQVGVSSPLDLIDGSWLPEDEVLTARFVGTRAAVVAAHEIAGATFDRLTRVIDLELRSPHDTPRTGGAT